jgi:hypothetical protein
MPKKSHKTKSPGKRETQERKERPGTLQADRRQELVSKVCQLSAVCCLLSAACCLLSVVCCLL